MSARNFSNLCTPGLVVAPRDFVAMKDTAPTEIELVLFPQTFARCVIESSLARFTDRYVISK
jgi:hypothetical protein